MSEQDFDDFVQMLDNSAPLLPDQARPIGIVGAPR